VIVLTEEFCREIQSHPIPMDLEAAKALSSSSSALDLFTWLIYRCFVARGEERVPLFGHWGLAGQMRNGGFDSSGETCAGNGECEGVGTPGSRKDPLRRTLLRVRASIKNLSRHFTTCGRCARRLSERRRDRPDHRQHAPRQSSSFHGCTEVAGCTRRKAPFFVRHLHDDLLSPGTKGAKSDDFPSRALRLAAEAITRCATL
jgi:hypothetical protein